ncbi:cell division protein FtsZ, partial [Roseomonas mucosa]
RPATTAGAPSGHTVAPAPVSMTPPSLRTAVSPSMTPGPRLAVNRQAEPQAPVAEAAAHHEAEPGPQPTAEPVLRGPMAAPLAPPRSPASAAPAPGAAPGGLNRLFRQATGLMKRSLPDEAPVPAPQPQRTEEAHRAPPQAETGLDIPAFLRRQKNN